MVDPAPAASSSSARGSDTGLDEARPVDFVGAVLHLIAHKWFIISVMLLCGAAGAVYAFVATPWYRADVVMMAAEQKSPLSGLGQIGGLASLAGIDLGGGEAGGAMAALRSRSFIAEFIESKDLMPILFADEWDSSRKAWKNSDPGNHPDIRKAVEYFNEKVRGVGENGKTGEVTISIQWTDAKLAADWANEIADLINARLREKALAEAERNVRYLQQEIAASNIASMQQSIGRVLESEMQKLMMARGSVEFAFKIVDRAVPPRKRYRPQRALLIAMSAIAGAMLSVGYLLLRRTLVGTLRQRSTPQ